MFQEALERCMLNDIYVN